MQVIEKVKKGEMHSLDCVSGVVGSKCGVTRSAGQCGGNGDRAESDICLFQPREDWRGPRGRKRRRKRRRGVDCALCLAVVNARCNGIARKKV